jgi:hypothetical protein
VLVYEAAPMMAVSEEPVACLRWDSEKKETAAREIVVLPLLKAALIEVSVLTRPRDPVKSKSLAAEHLTVARELEVFHLPE